MPLLRRIFLLSDPIQTADPLALVPFLVTAGVVGLELTLVTLNRRVRRLLMLVAAGYALGIPTGLIFQPPSAVFALFAYLSALGVSALALVTWRRITPLRLLSVLLIFGALALTYVRSAWAAVLFTALVLVVVTRGGALKRVGPIVLVLVILAPVVLGGSTSAA